jgi:hypothetical protein
VKELLEMDAGEVTKLLHISDQAAVEIRNKETLREHTAKSKGRAKVVR